jgi:phosphatidate cytidylyltransferase
MYVSIGRMEYLSHLTPAVQLVMGIVLGVLVFATIVAQIFIRLKPGKTWNEINTRIRSWWTIVLVLFADIAIAKKATVIFLGFISFLALKEYLSLIPTRRSDRRVLFWAYLAIPLQYYWAYSNWYGMFITFIPIYIFLFIPLRMLMAGETKDFLRAASTIQWGLMMTVFSISHMAFLLTIAADKNPLGGWPGLLLFLLITTETNDIAQFISGKLFGKNKVVPTISPNKTVEGLAGGMIFSMILGYFLAPAITPISAEMGIVFGGAISFFGFIGDVSVSAVKRDIGVKDSGTMLPGHGGILDRIDSLTYTAPLFYHLLWFYVNKRY